MLNIALFQWLVGVFTDTLRPAHAEIPHEQSAEDVPANADPENNAERARNEVAATYRSRIVQLQHQLNQATIQRKRAYAYLAISLIVAIVFLYLHFELHLLPLLAAALPTIAALVAAGRVQKCGQRTRDCSQLLGFYRRRMQCLQQEWMGKGDSGMDLLIPGHLSALDIDLFGEGSMFELLCDVETPAGRDTLARWLQEPASPEKMVSHQQAVRSLADRTSLREQLAIARSGNPKEYSWERLCAWFVADPIHFPRWAPWAAFLLSLCVTIAAACGWQGVMTAHETLRVMVLIGVPEAALVLYLRGRVQMALEGLALSSARLESLRQVCRLFETEHMESPLLVRMQQKLQGASQQIYRLQGLVRTREARDNEWAFWLLFPLAWKTQWTMRIERWRRRHGNGLVQSLTVLGELEALMALAIYAYENPEDPYPELVDEGPLFEATGMGHPLMDVRSCVRNDLKLGGGTSFLLVTGSNMSGKSTLLRATGLNATLAWMGAPVRATRLRLSPLRVCASIRVNDSLMSGRSHFYTEVERLKATLDCAASSPPVLFLIDELFAGTNSADRRIAAEAVIRLLVERHAIGMVTSHDLSLTEIPEKSKLKGINVHFAHLPSEKGLEFDYHLRAGKVKQSNALKIIQMVGIPIN